VEKAVIPQGAVSERPLRASSLYKANCLQEKAILVGPEGDEYPGKDVDFGEWSTMLLRALVSEEGWKIRILNS